MSDQGGDSACWADRVCPACGMLDERARRDGHCPHCGTRWAGDDDRTTAPAAAIETTETTEGEDPRADRRVEPPAPPDARNATGPPAGP